MAFTFPDKDFTTPEGPLESDRQVAEIRDEFIRNREFEKRHRHPNVEVIYSSDAMPRKNLEIYYYQSLYSAMARGCSRIIVEPSNIGVRIGQYINLGYYMHLTCVGTGLVAIFLGLLFRHKIYIIYSCSIASCILLHANNLYYSNFVFSGYQFMDNDDVEHFLRQMIPEIQLSTDCPVVIMPYDSFKRRCWHHLVGCAAGIMMFTLIYRGLPVLLCRCRGGTIPEVIRYEGNLFEFFSVLPLFLSSYSASSPSNLSCNFNNHFKIIREKLGTISNYIFHASYGIK